MSNELCKLLHDIRMLAHRLLTWCESPLFPISPSVLILQVDNNSGYIAVAISFLTVAVFFLIILIPWLLLSPTHSSFLSLYPRHWMIKYHFHHLNNMETLENVFVSLHHREVRDSFQSRYKDKGTKIGKNIFSIFYTQHLRPIFHVSYWYKVNFLR